MILVYIFLILPCFDAFVEDDERRASLYHDNVFEPENLNWFRRFVEANWNYETNVTDDTASKLNDVSLEMAVFTKQSWKIFNSYDWRNFKNETLKRLFQMNSKLGISALDDQKLSQITELVSHMSAIFSKTSICDYKNRENCSLYLYSDIVPIMETSRDYYELLYIWEQWHDKCGRPLKEPYEKYVSLSNEAARLNDFRSTAEMWLDDYQSDTLERNIELIWQQLKPYYEELHAYVRRRLITFYGADKIRADGPIPAHILGDPWGQRWMGLYDFLAPFPDKPTLDISEALKKQGYTVKKMFELSESFYQSIGLLDLPESFWKLSIVTKPPDRDFVCHASAWQFTQNDVRIKMCTRIEMDDLFIIHHELGHIQYYMQYSSQPTSFQQSANPGFHEAIGDTMVLSVSTPEHLKELGLLMDFQDDKEFELNFLLLKALQKVAALPFNYLVDKWRWKVFRGEITPQNYNSKWWEMSKYYQGIEPVHPRTDMDFDPGAKVHIPSDEPYLSYFISIILEFQFHEALCRAAGQFPQKPLHKCSIYQNKRAGEIFGNMLRQGSSRHWKDILEELTGTREMDPISLINYFEPLFRYIRMVNRENNEYIGWRDAKRYHTNRKTLVGLPIRSKLKFIRQSSHHGYKTDVK